MFGIKPEPEVTTASAPVPPPKEKPIRFSDNPNMGVFNSNKYKHMTKNQLEDESEVHARAGSLWNNEGQSAYLFSQNTIRREGELLKVKLDGASRSQVETKISVIKKLLARVETPIPTLINPGMNNPNLPGQIIGGSESPNNSLTGAAPGAATGAPIGTNSSGVPAAGGVSGVAGNGAGNNIPNRNPASEGIASGAPGGAASSAKISNPQNQNEDTGPEFNVDTIPTRIVERMTDGNYRVKGSQSFMIGKREFKVIVMGLVRPDDFNEEGISSGKLLDPQFDVVSLRRSQQ